MNSYLWSLDLAKRASAILGECDSFSEGARRVAADPAFAHVRVTRSSLDSAFARYGMGTAFRQLRRGRAASASFDAIDVPIDTSAFESPAPTPPDTSRELPHDTEPPAADEEAERIRVSVLAQLAAFRSIPRGEPGASPNRRNIVRVIVPDSHGAHIDLGARDAMLADLRRLDPDEAVFLGDHLDCGGTFNSHQRNYTSELTESYVDDIAATNEFLTLFQELAPRARIHYIEGNHEAHVERWASRMFDTAADASALLERFGPEAVLDLKRRGIRYYKRSEFYDGLSIPGCIKLGECYFVHGVSHSKHASSVHLGRFGANVVFGHVHRAQHVSERTVTSDGFGAWCPGTLAKLQPLYRHTAPSSWNHGYGVQFVNPSGQFLHINVPIHKGESLLMDVSRFA